MTSFLQSHGVSSVTQLQAIEQLPPLLGGGDPPKLVIVHLDPDPQHNLEKLTLFIRQYPHISFFVMTATLETSLVLDAMHAGVKEFVPLPVNQQKFTAALERVAQMEGLEKRAKVLHFIPSMGGCGSTTVACNIAVSLAKQ